MSILIFSDTHGNTKDMVRIINETEEVHAVIHAGDYVSDSQKVSEYFPYIPLYSVSGNCDFLSAAPESISFMIQDKTFFLTHGHRFGVKTELGSIKAYSRENDIDITIFGHTHVPLIKYFGKTTIINPGAMHGYSKSYCILDIKNGKAYADIIKL